MPNTQEEIEAIEIVKGDCSYWIIEQKVSEVQFENIKMIDSTSNQLPTYGMIFLRVKGLGGGREIIPYVLREPLQD